MAKVIEVKSARKQHECGKCGCVIEIGQPYRHWRLRYGGGRVWCTVTRTRCTAKACDPKPSELTNNEHHQRVFEWQEREFEFADVDDFESTKEELVSELQEYQDELNGRLENMPEGLQQGDTGQTLQSRIESLESVASELDGVEVELPEEPSEPAAQAEGEDEEVYQQKLDDFEKAKEEWESKVKELLSDAAQQITDALGGLE